MELIGTGILLAIGFMIAPIVLGAILTVIGLITAGISSIFK